MHLTVMNPTSTDPTAPPPPPQPPRSSFSCDRHPAEQFTGFCPSCLCERLTTLDNSSSNTPSSSRRPSSASAAIKSLFSSSSSNAKPTSAAPPPPPPIPSKPSSSFPELRRTKSFSASKNEALGQFFEPQRKSCDVRGRNTLWSLFTLDDENKVGGGGGGGGGGGNKPSSINAAASSSHQNHQSVRSSVADKPVFEETENEEDFRDPENIDDEILRDEDDDVDTDEIRSIKETHLEKPTNAVEFEINNGEMVEEESAIASSLKMKEHIDLTTQEKKSSGFWAAASVFSKKWHKWRRKQKLKKHNNGGESFATLPVEKPISRQYRETQSEIADYGFGRRSCDTDPRFSLDAARISFDDARYSFDEPRASWDGYIMGGRSFPRMAPMLSVIEDAPIISRPDMHIPVEEPPLNSLNECEALPGGTVQTREYYLDSSSSRRRKSLDRSSSIRKTAASVVAEIDELKMVSYAKVSPTTAESFHGAKVVGEREFIRDSNCNEGFELGSGYREYSNSLNGERKDSSKKSRRWSGRIWGFIHRLSNGGNKEEDDEKYSRVNGVGRSMSVSWQDSHGDEGERGRLNINMLRSNSSVSYRNGGSFGSMRKSGVDKLEKNWSARYSPSHVDNGLLRFYLTPMRGSRRGGGGIGKVKANSSSSIARSVLRLY